MGYALVGAPLLQASGGDAGDWTIRQPSSSSTRTSVMRIATPPGSPVSIVASTAAQATGPWRFASTALTDAVKAAPFVWEAAKRSAPDHHSDAPVPTANTPL